MKDEAMLALAKEFAKNLKTEADLNNFSKALKKLTVETILNAELTDHLGYEKHSPRVGKNARNGYTTKRLLTDDGEFELDTPRDRVVHLSLSSSRKVKLESRKWIVKFYPFMLKE